MRWPRLAGVLAIAVFGIVMVKAFTVHLDRSLETLRLPPVAMQEIRSKEIELAGMQLPKNLEPNAKVAVQDAISDAFLFGFRLVLLSCAGLSMGSAAIAWRLVPSR
jgi:hypothetical protein